MASESRDLLAFLEARRLTHVAPISSLKSGRIQDVPPPPELLTDRLSFRPNASTANAPRVGPSDVYVIAVDGNFVLSNLVRQLHDRDPAWFLEGPLSPILVELLRAEVLKWRNEKLEPVFVFSGMAVHGDVESFVNTAEELDQREAAWMEISAGRAVDRDQMERAFDVVLGEDIEMAVMRILAHSFGVEVVRAPFLQWGQMISFLVPPHRRVNDVYGPAELLLFDHVSRVIVDIDFERGMLVYVDKQEILVSLFREAFLESPKHANALFLDLGLLTASHQALALLRPDIESLSIESLHEQIRQVDKDRNKVTDFVFSQFVVKQDANHQTWKLMKGRAFVRHSMVLIPKTGEIVCLSRLLPVRVKVPKNLVGVLGSRLPPFMYFLQFVGLLSVGSMTTISQNYIRDDNPVSDTVQYRTCMEVVISLRTQILYQLVQHFQKNDDYRKRVKVSWIRWFEPISVPVLRPPDIRLDSWNLAALPDLPPKDLQQITFKDCVQYSTRGVRNTEQGVPQEFACKNLHQLLIAVLMRSLDLLGYFTHITTGAVPAAGESVTGPSLFAEILDSIRFPQHAAPAVLLIELLRTRALTLFTLTYVRRHTVPAPPWETPEACLAAFASRVATLVHVPTTAAPYTGQVNRDVVSFNVIVKNFTRTMRTLTEVICSSMFLDGSAVCDAEVYVHVPALLPFQAPPNCVGGFLMHFLLTVCLNLPTKEECWIRLAEAHETIVDIRQAVTDVILFWETASLILHRMHAADNDQTVQAEMVAITNDIDVRIADLKMKLFA